eukprot:TRINITY_DN1318_c0_g1_i2.p1 TRINITY_DN1318_c0_g1~~TRINITY_DN1318_c0_g1_i2.p1  ORF type:complete len:710 (-),score=65.77 TRINITY_DN1318_c0_g1_i2:54-2183(-)
MAYYSPVQPETSDSKALAKVSNTSSSGSGTEGTSSDGSDDKSTTHEITLSQDIFTHSLIVSVRRGFCHQDSIRSTLLVSLVMTCQVVACLLFATRSFYMIVDLETTLTDALKETYDPENYRGSDLEAVCGKMIKTETPLYKGYGKEIRWDFDWLHTGIAHTAVQEYIYLLSPTFSVVFWLLLLVWIQRCLADVRDSNRHLHALLRFTTVTSGHEAIVQTDQTELVGIQRRIRAVFVVLYAVKIFVAVCLLVDGYWLLLCTTTLVSLVLNAMALEFVFTFGEQIVNAVLDAREVTMMSIVGHYSRQGNAVTHFLRTASKDGLSLKWWRGRAWMRFVLILVIPILLMIPRWYIFDGLLRRGLTICITRGATDGFRPLSLSTHDVIFPLPGFCETNVESFVMKDSTSCTMTRSSRTGEFTNGMCKSAGTLSKDRWNGDVSIVAELCSSFYLGKGTQPGDKIQALRVPSESNHPLVFGCSAEDFNIEVTPGILQKLFGWTIMSNVRVTCARPAGGLFSGSKASGYVPPNYYFKEDPRSPIEHQVGVCEKLEKDSTCQNDDCEVSLGTIYGRSCDMYCQDAGLVCSAAFTELGDQCQRGDALPCDQVVLTLTAVCRCQLPPEKRQCALLQAERRIHGDPCQVLVPLPDAADEVFEAKDCDAYCASASLKCVRQYEIAPDSEIINNQVSFQCADQFDVTFGSSRVAIRVCECGPP